MAAALPLMGSAMQKGQANQAKMGQDANSEMAAQNQAMQQFQQHMAPFNFGTLGSPQSGSGQNPQALFGGGSSSPGGGGAGSLLGILQMFRGSGGTSLGNLGATSSPGDFNTSSSGSEIA